MEKLYSFSHRIGADAMNTRMVTTGFRMAQWTQVIQDRKVSGENIKEYCQNRGLSRDAYFYWQKKIKEAACDQFMMMETEPKQAGLITTGFAEVQVKENQGCFPKKEHVSCGQLSIEVTGIKITADDVYPADQLAYLLRELVRPC